MHAEMYMLVWFLICASQCCVFSCVICPVHALFLVPLSFISKGETGNDPFDLAAKPSLVQEPRGQSRGV